MVQALLGLSRETIFTQEFPVNDRVWLGQKL